MDVDEIHVKETGYDSAMRKLELPSDLLPEGQYWRLSTEQYHDLVSRELGKCDEVAPMSARVTGLRTIILMPAEGVSWDDTFTAVKKVLKTKF